MRVEHGGLYNANLNPRFGSEPGKVRPVLVLQTDLLNQIDHLSSWIVPCTTRLTGENLLRVPLPRGMAGNPKNCELMIDQSRSIDNRRFIRFLGKLPPSVLREVKDKLRSLGEL